VAVDEPKEQYMSIAEILNLRVMRFGVLSQDISKIVDSESYLSLNT
jgi:hypothetical protein